MSHVGQFDSANRPWLTKTGFEAEIVSDDHNGHFPLASNWCDAIRPKRTNERDPLTCSFLADEGKRGGYAFNSALNNAALPSMGSGRLLMVYESKPDYNVTGQPKQLRPRYRHTGGSIIMFADGHLKWSPKRETPYLICDPQKGRD